jgi:hypothetical protein
MKKIFSLIFAILISIYSNSQIVSLHFFQIQEIIKTEFDTTYSEIYNVNLNYNFDLNQNIVFTEINGHILQETISVYSNNDSVITLVYTDNASAGWVLDLNEKKVVYFEISSNSTKELEIINPILINTEVPKTIKLE